MNSLPAIHEDPQLWLEMLADGELSQEERGVVWKYLEANPESWKDCAVAFWDHQFFCRDLKTGESSSVAGKERYGTRRTVAGRKWGSILGYSGLAALLAFVLGCLSYPMMFQKTNSDGSFAERTEKGDDIGELPLRDLPATPVMNPASWVRPNSLIEIENTSTRAVYYFDHRLPRFFSGSDDTCRARCFGFAKVGGLSRSGRRSGSDSHEYTCD